ncbi:hypothetical protein PMW00_12455 [Clostridium paraputrificum]|uniref:hypothetical protein n=1 Tax=Clostridium paraputrificum TaxID=29363 RepID=UPI002330ED22|nr:hypothetical protein [Clostridium paraputrificum]MDB2103831.1 hypothetical protein [Clostridium paraputrificum]
MKDIQTTLSDLRLTRENYNEIELILNQYIQLNGEISLSIRTKTLLSEHKNIKEVRVYELNNFLRLELIKSITDIEKIHLYGEIIDYEIEEDIYSQDNRITISNIMTNFMRQLADKYNRENRLICDNKKD